MNREYWDYYFSKKKKLTDRAFKLRLAVLMTSMLACAAVMASSAFALFTCDIKRSTTLTAADFKVLEFNPVQMQNDEQNVTNVIHIVTTPGVLGYCKIPVYGTDNTTRYYYTEPFVGEIYFKIATAVGTGIGQPEAFWGNPRNVLDPEIELLGVGASVVHSYVAPQQDGESESTGGNGGQDISQENNDNETDNKQSVDETEKKDEVIKTPMLSVSPSVNKEQTTVTENMVTEKETSSVVEKSETTVTPSVSEEKDSVENSDSTATEAPMINTPPSTNSSDSGTSDSSGTNVSASDNGNSSENSSSGNSGNDGFAGTGNSYESATSSVSEASTGETPSDALEGGGE